MWTAFARTHYERLNARYASDVIDDEYGLIEPLLPAARCGGRRRTTDLREVLNAILYLVRTGCPWDMLPSELSVLDEYVPLVPNENVSVRALSWSPWG